MNTKRQSSKTNQRQRVRHSQTSRKQNRSSNMLQNALGNHEQEHPETRLTR